MNVDVIKAILARAGWTAAQAALSVISIDQLSSAVHIPGSLQWALVGIAAGLSTLKSFVATKVGDPSTVTFGSKSDGLDDKLADAYSNADGVEIGSGSTDQVGPHGVN